MSIKIKNQQGVEKVIAYGAGYIDTELGKKENTVNKGVNNGYAPLDSGGKVPLANLPNTLLKYISTWDASTNTPTLASPETTKVGNVYIVSAAGTRFGFDWKVGDWLIYNSIGVIELSPNSDEVVSVNGQTGVVSLSTNNIDDYLNKRYVTDAEKVIIGNTSGENTGDETQITIKTKLGASSVSADGYLTKEDFATFNGKEIGGAVNTHNTSGTAHTDIRALFSGYYDTTNFSAITKVISYDTIVTTGTYSTKNDEIVFHTKFLIVVGGLKHQQIKFSASGIYFRQYITNSWQDWGTDLVNRNLLTTIDDTTINETITPNTYLYNHEKDSINYSGILIVKKDGGVGAGAKQIKITTDGIYYRTQNEMFDWGEWNCNTYTKAETNAITGTTPLTSLTTTIKTSLVNAINWLYGIVGDITTLTTTNKTSAVSAINELQSSKQPSGDYEVTVNKVTSISPTSTDVQYPSAKAVYEMTPQLVEFEGQRFVPTQFWNQDENGFYLDDDGNFTITLDENNNLVLKDLSEMSKIITDEVTGTKYILKINNGQLLWETI